MTCPHCQNPTYRLIVDAQGTYCAACRGLSENGGVNISGILTRNSDRVRAQQQRFEGDMIPPHRFDKQLNKLVPNEEFMAQFPDRLPTYFTEQELKAAGYSKSNKIYEKQAKKQAQHDKERGQVEFVEDESKVEEVIAAAA